MCEVLDTDWAMPLPAWFMFESNFPFVKELSSTSWFDAWPVEFRMLCLEVKKGFCDAFGNVFLFSMIWGPTLHPAPPTGTTFLAQHLLVQPPWLTVVGSYWTAPTSELCTSRRPSVWDTSPLSALYNLLPLVLQCWLPCSQSSHPSMLLAPLVASFCPGALSDTRT